MKRFAIYGASGCGRGVMPLARAQLREKESVSWELVFVDDNPPSDWLNGHRVLKYNDWLAEESESHHVCLAISNGVVRQNLAARCAEDGVTFFDVKASNVVVMDDVHIGSGAVLCPFVTLTSNIVIGQHFHANLYSYVEHDCVIGNFVTFAPGVQCNGNVVIEDYAYIGAGAMIRQGKPSDKLVIGRGAIVGMGAVVTKSVAPGAIVIGNPARLMNTFVK
jgi:sugar O-acyltransferase (sialic acid O-acetyltransferase NeuD family)